VGREGLGFIVAMKTFDKSRPGIGALGVGLAQGALDLAVEYARKRVQFDKPIISFQAIQHKLADMAIKTEASRSLIYSIARYMDTDPQDASKFAAMGKVFAADVAMEVSTQCGAGAWRIRLYAGLPGRKDDARRQDPPDLRGYETKSSENIIGQELNKEYGRMKDTFSDRQVPICEICKLLPFVISLYKGRIEGDFS